MWVTLIHRLVYYQCSCWRKGIHSIFFLHKYNLKIVRKAVQLLGNQTTYAATKYTKAKKVKQARTCFTEHELEGDPRVYCSSNHTKHHESIFLFAQKNLHVYSGGLGEYRESEGFP